MNEHPTKILHATDVQTFKTCRRRYKYEYIDRIKPMEQDYVPFEFGKMGHHLLAQYYRLMGGMEPGPNQEFNLSPDDEQQVKTLFRHYVWYYGPNDMKPISVEKEIEVKLEGEWSFVFTMDLLAIHRESLWIVDHKFLRGFPDETYLQIDNQITAYLWACREVGIPVEGMLYNVIMKKPIRGPQRLNNGRFSVAEKNLAPVSTWLWDEALEEAGECDANYPGVRELLDDSKWFARFYVKRTPQQLDSYGREVARTIREIDSTDWFYANPHPVHCGSCAYKDLCRIEDKDPSKYEQYKKELYEEKETQER